MADKLMAIRSVRAYRRVIDYAIQQAIQGRMSCREAKALSEMGAKGAELHMAELNLKAAGVSDVEDDQHVLGSDGGLDLPSPDIETAQAPSLLQGNLVTIPGSTHRQGHYETTAPPPDNEETTAEFVNTGQAGPACRRYPVKQDGQTYEPIQNPDFDPNTALDGELVW